MQISHVRVREGLLDRYSLFGVKDKHFLDQIDGIRVRVAFKELVEVLALLLRKLFHKCPIIFILDHADKSSIGVSNQVGDHLHLLLLGAGGKKCLPPDKLCQDAAYRPDIDSRGVLLPTEDDFGCPIPSCCDVVGKLGV